MKPTISMILFFLLIGFLSGAMNITMLMITSIISMVFIYIAWLEDKKAKHEVKINRQRQLRTQKIVNSYKR